MDHSRGIGEGGNFLSGEGLNRFTSSGIRPISGSVQAPVRISSWAPESPWGAAAQLAGFRDLEASRLHSSRIAMTWANACRNSPCKQLG